MSKNLAIKRQKTSWTVIIPQWENSFVKSQKTAVKYWLWKDRDKLPEKYKKLRIHVPFTVGTKEYCADNMGNRFVKNPNKQGKPNTWVINGQALYNATMNWRLRKVVTKYFHEYFKGYITDQLEPIVITGEQRLSVRCDIYEIKRKPMPDASNMWPLTKWFEDALQEAGMLPNDSPEFIEESGAHRYHWVTTPEERKLVFTISIL